MEQELESEVAGIVARFAEDMPVEEMDRLKEYYYKRKYLLRIKEKLSTFASRN
jgi:hypothetical protein